MRSKRVNGDRLTGLIPHVILGITCFLWSVPLYATFINSFKLNDDVVATPFLINASTFTTQNYMDIFSKIDIPSMYINSILITFIPVVLIVILAPMAAYYIARTNEKLGTFLMMFFLVGMMIPTEVTLIPLVHMLNLVGLMGSRGGMYIYYLGSMSALSIFMYSKFMKTIPFSLEEAAYIDGASRWRIYTKIIFPLLAPATATVVVFVGLFVWNDFLTPMVLLGTSKGTTITLGVYKMMGPYTHNFGAIYAFALISSIPIIILYVVLQKHFIKGMVAGALKG